MQNTKHGLKRVLVNVVDNWHPDTQRYTYELEVDGRLIGESGGLLECWMQQHDVTKVWIEAS